MTRLLLDRGADPNDDETPYHAPETYDNTALKVLVESGKLNDDSLATVLIRKTDWHDLEGIRWLLEQGIDPNRKSRWGNTAIQHALSRDNAVAIIDLLLDHGADPLTGSDVPDPRPTTTARSALFQACRRGRGDVLASLERRGIPIELTGLERLLAACARSDHQAVRNMGDSEPDLVSELRNQGGLFLARFAGNGNTPGVACLLDLGISVDAPDPEGDYYFDVAQGSTALHVAAWRARHETVKLLLERGANPNAIDGKGRTPLQLAVKACVDSYWSDRRSPESVAALLSAGASARGIPIPTGYAVVDQLLQETGESDERV